MGFRTIHGAYLLRLVVYWSKWLGQTPAAPLKTRDLRPACKRARLGLLRVIGEVPGTKSYLLVLRPLAKIATRRYPRITVETIGG
jgi:hypothetical protein